MATYQQIAIQDFKDMGITVDSLIEQYPQNLMRLKLACDMGISDISLPEDKEGHHLLYSAASTWIDLATVWPPQDSIAGIPVPTPEKAIIFQIAKEAKGVNVLSEIPVRHQTEAIRLAEVKVYGMALEFIPVDQQTEEVRLLSVQGYGAAIRFIPAHQQSEAVRLAAVRKNGCAIQYIPIDQQSKAVRLSALKQSKFSQEYMPSEIAKRLLAELDEDASFSL